VFGFVFGHPRHLDGRELLTSPVLRCCANHIVSRSGSEYELGSIDPAYERRYPGALRRLCTRLDPDSKVEVQECASWRDACVFPSKEVSGFAGLQAALFLMPVKAGCRRMWFDSSRR
jgi:hypothetical protein